jgi:tetratricopeptide (TPR) repeat protein
VDLERPIKILFRQIANRVDQLKRLLKIADAAGRQMDRDTATFKGDVATLMEWKDAKDEGDQMLHDGDFPKAAEAFDRAIKLRPDEPTAWAGKAYAYASLNDRKVAEKAVEKAGKLGAPDLDIAKAYAILGRKDKMLSHLRTALSSKGLTDLRSIAKGHIAFKAFHDDPDFQRVITKT